MSRTISRSAGRERSWSFIRKISSSYAFGLLILAENRSHDYGFLGHLLNNKDQIDNYHSKGDYCVQEENSKWLRQKSYFEQTLKTLQTNSDTYKH